MARIGLFCTVLGAILALAIPARAQESLRIITGMDAGQALDWHNPELAFDVNLPPGVNAASLTLYADPEAIPPRPGTLMRVSVNGHDPVVLDPKPLSFSARIDLPATHLRAGLNHVSIRFEGAGAALCPVEADGGWRLNLDRSRLDIARSSRIASFAQLEDWLAQGPWSLSSIAFAQTRLAKADQAAFGALIVQGLALRAAKVPHIALSDAQADLRIMARISPTSAGPQMILHPGAQPQLEFLGRDSADILAAARLFAARMVKVDAVRVNPAMLVHAPLVRRPGALKGVENTLARPVWAPRPFISAVRTPHGGQTRLVVDLERPDWVSARGTELVLADAGKALRRSLKRRRSHLVMPLKSNKATVVRRFSLARITHPEKAAVRCPAARQDAPLRLLSARIESSGYAQAHGLSRFAVDGAPFTRQNGAGTAIVLAASSPARLHAAWRALGRIALASGAPLTSAWYGSEAKLAPRGASLLVLGPRERLPRRVLAHMPPAFARGAAAGPGESRLNGANRSQWLVRSAYARDPVPPGLGVAGFGHAGAAGMLVLSAETRADFIPAMNAFADGPAIDFFAGNVLRWRAGQVEINAIDPKAGTLVSAQGLPFILFLVAGVCLAGLWTIRWHRAFKNKWQA